MSIDLACFTDIDMAAADAAGALDRAGQAKLHDRIDWFRLTLAHCPPAGTPFILRARDGKHAAWLFLMRDGYAATALASWYTLDYAPIFTAPPSHALLTAMLRAIDCALIDLAPLTPESAALFNGAPGWIACHSPASINWSVATRGLDWDQYWQARPSRLRNTVARRSRAVATRILARFDPDAWAAYECVYAASWKPEEGAPAFLRALAEQEGAAGTLRLGLADIDGETVAAQLWLVEGGIATIHKLAHVEAARAYSPGSVLSAAMFRHAITQDRVDRIDFGTGDDAYKADWTDTARPLVRLRLWNARTLRGVLGAARDNASVLARRLRAS